MASTPRPRDRESSPAKFTNFEHYDKSALYRGNEPVVASVFGEEEKKNKGK